MHSVVGVIVGSVAAIACLIATAVSAQSQQRAPTSRPSGILGPADQRAPVSSGTWPWNAIGRINVVYGPAHRGHCTGTLIGAQHILTAAHCLFDTRLNTFVKPHQVHFVAAQSRDGQFKSHGVAAGFATDPAFDFAVEKRPRYDQIRTEQIRNDWAIVTLANRFELRPIPLLVVRKADLPGGRHVWQSRIAF